MICQACQAGHHQQCTLDDCECPDRREQELVERRLNAIRWVDERVAASVLTTLLYGGSAEARMLTEGAGRDAVCSFHRHAQVDELLTVRTHIQRY